MKVKDAREEIETKAHSDADACLCSGNHPPKIRTFKGEPGAYGDRITYCELTVTFLSTKRERAVGKAMDFFRFGLSAAAIRRFRRELTKVAKEKK